MVSDAELIQGLREFLRSSDLRKTTNSIVRQKLEDDFSVDLSERKPFIREQVENFLYTCVSESPPDVRVAGDEEEEFDDDERGVGSESDVDGDVLNSDESEDAAIRNCKDRRDTVVAVGNSGKITDKGETAGRANGSKVSIRRPSKEVAKGAIRSKLCALSPQLETLLGKAIMTRFEVLSQLKEYIAERNLQDPSDSDNINCNEELQSLFGVKSVKASEMNMLLSKHLGAVKPSERRKIRRQEKRQQKEDLLSEAQKNQKKQKRTVTSGFLAPAPISETFMKFLGTGETELTRAEAIKRIWIHIKDHNLQDPLEKKMVICDGKLKELFGVDSFHGFTVSKLLCNHFVKP